MVAEAIYLSVMPRRAPTLRDRLRAVRDLGSYRWGGHDTIGAWYEAAGVSSTNMNAWFANEGRDIGFAIVERLADAAGVDRAWLMTGAGLEPVRSQDPDQFLNAKRAQRLTKDSASTEATPPSNQGVLGEQSSRDAGTVTAAERRADDDDRPSLRLDDSGATKPGTVAPKHSAPRRRRERHLR